jgi:hypothetical protein
MHGIARLASTTTNRGPTASAANTLATPVRWGMNQVSASPDVPTSTSRRAKARMRPRRRDVRRPANHVPKPRPDMKAAVVAAAEWTVLPNTNAKRRVQITSKIRLAQPLRKKRTARRFTGS